MKKKKMPKHFFSFLEMKRLECITSQEKSDVICLMASINNMMQFRIYTSFDQFKTDCRATWLSMTWRNLTNADRPQEVIDNTLRELIGPRGVSPSLCIPLLRKLNVNAISVPKAECINIKFGIIMCHVENFFHAIAIHNGYAIDSIGCKKYVWKGVLQGYKGEQQISFGVAIK